jgi:hypothetical protein
MTSAAATTATLLQGRTRHGNAHQSDHSNHFRGRRRQCRGRGTEGLQGNTIAGAIGGLGGGQLLQAAIPAIAGAAGGDLDVGAIVGQIIGGGAGGAILTVIAGLVKSMMASQQTR